MPVAIRIALVAMAAASSDAVRMGASAAYEAFRREFGVQRIHKEAGEYLERAALLEKRREEVKQHNLRPDVSWFAVLNKFADYTDAEFRGMLGHSLSERGRPAGGEPQVSSLLQSMPGAAVMSSQKLAQTVDYRTSLNASLPAMDQGGCGSCWAVAAAGAMETHAEMAEDSMSLISRDGFPTVSYEELVDCVDNSLECGGTGGCNGATSEQAFEFIAKNGLVLKSDYKGYQSGGDLKCKMPSSPPAMTATSFVRLETNSAPALQAALATVGPVVVSAEATEWLNYGGGVFHGCDNKDAEINHAILAMGYGTDDKSGKDFWLIRNSWGENWGEGGYIRLFKHKEGETFCGVDHKPLEGVGCKGGPATLPVCGMCGILADSAYPTGVQITAPTV